MGMRAAWYEKQGPAREVFVVGEMPEPLPGFNEVRTGIVSTNRLLKTLPPRAYTRRDDEILTSGSKKRMNFHKAITDIRWYRHSDR